MILKLLLVIGVIATVYFLFIKEKPAVARTSKKQKTKTKPTPQANDMIECATCGIYCELNDTIISASKYYCSSECVDKAK